MQDATTAALAFATIAVGVLGYVLRLALREGALRRRLAVAAATGKGKKDDAEPGLQP